MSKSRPDEDETPRLPIPEQVVSNGEFLPRPPSPKQKRIAALTHELAEHRARQLGMKRRDFLRTAAGSATMMLAMNHVYGCDSGRSGGATPSPSATATASPTAVPFNICDEDTRDLARAREVFSAPFFVMDVQTHHVDVSGLWYNAFRSAIAGLRFRELEDCDGGDTDCKINLISRANYIQEVFLDSETAVAVMSGVPPGAAGILPNTTMAATRDQVNTLANSQRCLAQMLIEPRSGTAAARTRIDDIAQNAEELGAIAIKCYPGSDRWYLDDEQIAYPMYERALAAGIEVIAVHKGFPGLFGAQSAPFVQSHDIVQAARDWPQLNFVIYHSGYFDNPQTLPDGTVIPAGIDQFAAIMEANPDLTNVYAEIGSTFAFSLVEGAAETMEILGRLLHVVGPDRVIWGTDSVWWGTPQWQIDAFKTIQISEELQQTKGYPALTDDIRAKVFGLNSAQLYGVDPELTRCTLANDALTMARGDLLDRGARPVAQPHGPRTRREFLQLAALGR